ncbi:MAG: MobA/MobL family protein [Endozoicomonadaceae bacterium]|nr:MobA/MobL family protein [Endozoicomonadaceae bacterium]
MAIYFCHFRWIRRSQQHNIIAAAAYRAGEKLIDYTNNKVHFFKNKTDVRFKKILLPNQAPRQFMNREILWNQVNLKESRKNARLAQEIIFALPSELTQAQQHHLILEFSQYYFVNQGLCADICIHDSVDKINPHTHILLTTRHVDSMGFQLKQPEWQKKKFLLYIRQEWANFQNLHLAQARIHFRVDHRRLIDQGIQLQPMHRMALKYQKPVLTTIKKRNTKNLLNNPSQALHYLTLKQTSFSIDTLHQFLTMQTNNQIDYQLLKKKILHSKECLKLGLDLKKNLRFTSRTVINTEYVLLKNAAYLSQKKHDKHHTAHQSHHTLTDNQKKAVLHALQNRQLICFNSTQLDDLKKITHSLCDHYIQTQHLIYIITLTAKMHQNLKHPQHTICYFTLIDYLMQWQYHQKPNQPVIIILHEAHCIDLIHMEQLITSCVFLQAKLIVFSHAGLNNLRDIDAAFCALIEQTGCFQIQPDNIRYTTQSHHQLDIFSTIQSQKTFYAHANTTETIEHLLNEYTEQLKIRKTNQVILIAARNLDTLLFNELYRKKRVCHGILQSGLYLTVRPYTQFDSNTMNSSPICYKLFAIGDRIIFNQTHDRYHIQTGDFGTIKQLESNRVAVQCDRGHQVIFDPNQYQTFDYGYAVTAYQIQHQTIPYSLVFFNKAFDSTGAQLALTRHTQHVSIHYSRRSFHSLKALQEHIIDRKQQASFDTWQQFFALRRGYYIPSPSDTGAFSSDEQKVLYPWIRHEIILRYSALSNQYRLLYEEKLLKLKQEKQQWITHRPTKQSRWSQWLRNKKVVPLITLSQWDNQFNILNKQYQDCAEQVKKNTLSSWHDYAKIETQRLLSADKNTHLFFQTQPTHSAETHISSTKKQNNTVQGSLNHLIAQYDVQTYWTLIAANTLLSYATGSKENQDNPLDIPFQRCLHQLKKSTQLLQVNQAVAGLLMHAQTWLEKKQNFQTLYRHHPIFTALLSEYYCLQICMLNEHLNPLSDFFISIKQSSLKKIVNPSINLEQPIQLKFTQWPHQFLTPAGLTIMQSLHQLSIHSRSYQKNRTLKYTEIQRR